MIKRDLLSPGLHALVTAACVVVLVAGLKAAGEWLRPFVLALFLSIISLPLLRWLQQRGISAVLAVTLTILADIAILGGIVTLVGGSVTSVTSDETDYQESLTAVVDSTQQWLSGLGLPVQDRDLDEILNPGALMDLIGSTLKGVADLVSKAFLVLLTMIFILLEATGFSRKLAAAFRLGDGDAARISRAVRQVQHYLAIKTLVSLGTGVCIWLWLALLGIDFAALWGLVAFLFNYIPNLGSILAAIPAVLFAAVQQGPGAALMTTIAFVAVNLVLGNLIEPALMGRRMGLSTLVVFLSLVFWGWVWGPVGMLLSVPLTMGVKIFLENTDEFRWVAILLGKNPPPTAPESSSMPSK